MQNGSVLSRLRGELDSMPEALARIAKHILESPEKAVHQSVSEIGALSRSGPASVVRFCRQLGFQGVSDFKLALAADLANQAAAAAAPPSDKAKTIAYHLTERSVASLREAYDLIEPQRLRDAVQILGSCRHVLVFGAGISGIVAEFIAARLQRAGIAALTFRDPTLAGEILEELAEGAAAIAVSSSGITPDTVHLTRAVHMAGARTIVITSGLRSPLIEHADVVLPAPSISSPATGGLLVPVAAQILLVEAVIAHLAADSRKTGKAGSSRKPARKKVS